MQQQRTISKQVPMRAAPGLAMVVANGMQRQVAVGRTLRQTLLDERLVLWPHQSVIVGGEKVIDLESKEVEEGQVIAIVNNIVGGS